MCTYHTVALEVRGSGKGAQGWFELTDASVYVDHPAHAPSEHTLNIDFLNPGRGAAARVAVELDALSARRLAGAILAALDTAPPGLVEPEAGGRPSDEHPSGGLEPGEGERSSRR